jgi:hypothetical protein
MKNRIAMKNLFPKSLLSLFSPVLLCALAAITCSCSATRPLKGGKAITTSNPAGHLDQTLVQGENASVPSRQDQETVKVRTYTLPAGSRIEEQQVGLGRAGLPMTNTESVVVSAPMPVTEREETRAQTELGAAQKDTGREFSAKLASLKGIVWVGVALFVFGVVSLVWPPLKIVVGSVTTSAAVLLGGIALMILPSLIVGNELLILGGVVLGVGAWFLAHRHGELRGLVAATGVAPAPETDAVNTSSAPMTK